MKRTAAILFGGSIAGCALIIDLGDEPKLAPSADASTQDSGTPGPPDSAADGPEPVTDSGADTNQPPVYACGLPPSTNADCEACITANCCDKSKACAATPRCVQGLDCVKHCLVQPGCVNKCLADFPEVQDEALCSATLCSKCTPGPECSKLGKCVFDLPSDSLVRLVQEGRILDINEAVCKQARQEVATNGDSDAGVCFDP